MVIPIDAFYHHRNKIMSTAEEYVFFPTNGCHLCVFQRRLTKRQTVSKVAFSKMRSSKINGLQGQNAQKTGF